MLMTADSAFEWKLDGAPTNTKRSVHALSRRSCPQTCSAEAIIPPKEGLASYQSVYPNSPTQTNPASPSPSPPPSAQSSRSSSVMSVLSSSQSSQSSSPVSVLPSVLSSTSNDEESYIRFSAAEDATCVTWWSSVVFAVSLIMNFA